MAVVMHHSRARGTAKVVLLGIANHAGDGGSYPYVPTLARYANVSERQVQRALEELVALGELQIEYNQGGGRHTRADERPNLYEVLVSCPQGCSGGVQHRVDDCDAAEAPSGGSDDDLNGVTPTSPRDDDGATSMSPREPARGDTTVTPGVTSTSPITVLETIQPPRADPAPPARRQRQPDPLWDAVIAACGLTGAAVTSSARGAWNRAVKELRAIGATPDDVTAKAAAYRRQWPGATLTPTALARRWSEAATTGATPEPRHGPATPPPLNATERARRDGAALALTDVDADDLDDWTPPDPTEAQAFRQGFTEARARRAS